MMPMFRFLELLSLGVWLGAGFFVGVLLAPGAFALLPARELAGSVVGMALARLHWLGFACGGIYLVARFLGGSVSGETRKLAPVLVAIMLALTIVSQFVITPRLANLRAQMSAEHGSIDATPKEHPARQDFGKLHGVSSGVELLVLLLGAVALFYSTRQP